MPFIKSSPLMLGHMQDPEDPIRAIAEVAADGIGHWLAVAWTDAAAQDAPIFVTGEQELAFTAWIGCIAREMDQKVKPCASEILQAHADGRQAMLAKIAQEVGQPIRKDFAITFGFGGPAAATNEQAAANAAAFVREIGNDTRTTLSQLLQEGIAAGGPPAETARTLKESIGLTLAQARAVQNYRKLLETGSAEALTRALRDPRFDVKPEELVKLRPEQIDARVTAYQRRYIAYRATTIARYETLAAANGGAVNAISSSIAAGVLPETTRIGWLIAHDERTCPRCRSIVLIQPRGVIMGQPFHWQHNNRSGIVMFAPLHPDCRCTNTFRVMR